MTTQTAITTLTVEQGLNFIFLSYNKSGSQHNNTVSFNNCMLRVPGSTNPKNGQIVSIIQKWDGYRSEINYLLGGFPRYIINEKYVDLIRVQKRKSSWTNDDSSMTNNSNKVNWMTPLAKLRLC